MGWERSFEINQREQNRYRESFPEQPQWTSLAIQHYLERAGED